MNDKAFERKVQEDVVTVSDDGSTGLSRLGEEVFQSTEKVKKQITTWAEEGAAQFSRKLEGLKGEALDKIVVVTKTIEQDVDQGLGRYDVKVQDLADQVPGGFSKKIARYPWVTITISLAIGLLVGVLLKSTRRSLQSFGV